MQAMPKELSRAQATICFFVANLWHMTLEAKNCPNEKNDYRCADLQ